MRDTRWISFCVCWFVALAAAGNAQALTDEAIFRGSQFDWIRSGASTLGSGGSGVALVDDSTAIAINPAALRSVTGL